MLEGAEFGYLRVALGDGLAHGVCHRRRWDSRGEAEWALVPRETARRSVGLELRSCHSVDEDAPVVRARGRGRFTEPNAYDGPSPTATDSSLLELPQAHDPHPE